VANLCQFLHVLPKNGGLLDQDCLFVTSMDWVVEAQQFKEEMAQQEAQRKQGQNVGR
jgi:hypothetical protein